MDFQWYIDKIVISVIWKKVFFYFISVDLP